jgi:hypothetical protein
MRACLNSSNGENSIVDSFAVFPIQTPAALMYHSISWIACGRWALIAYAKYCRSPGIALAETVYLWLLQRSSCQVIGCRRCHNSHATVLWHACRVVGDTSWRTYPVCMPLNQTPIAAVSLAFMKRWGHIQLLSPSFIFYWSSIMADSSYVTIGSLCVNPFSTPNRRQYKHWPRGRAFAMSC